jgi:hypothetical protein
MKFYTAILIILIFVSSSLAQTAGSTNELNGQLLAPDLVHGVPRAIVLLTNPAGEVRYAFTNPFGYFRFREVPTGVTYTLTVKNKRYAFAPTTVVNAPNGAELNTVNDMIKIEKLSLNR